MGDYGREFLNFAIYLDEALLSNESRSVSGTLFGALALRPSVVYFSPRSYFLDGSAGEFVFPEGVELRFAPGARLMPSPGIVITIRGSIRAGRHQIFGRLTQTRDERWLEAEYSHLPNADSIPRSLVGLHQGTVNSLFAYLSRQTAPPGLIRIESLEIDEIYPEWWGAEFNESDAAIDSSDALQACFNAACRDRVRDGQPLPALPVSMRGPYLIDRKIVVEAPEGLPGALWLRGEDPVSHGGVGLASISRRSNNALRVLGLTDLDCAIELGPRVSAQFDGVSFQSIWSGSTGDENEVRGVLAVRRSDEEGDRSIILDRCGFVGGSQSAVEVSEDSPEKPRRGRLRLSLSQCTLNATRQDLEERFVRTRRLMDLRLRDDDSVGMSACFLRGNKQPGDTPLGRLSWPLDFEAGVFVVGGALHVRGSTFHFADGPRPSRPLDVVAPDGQDVWLERGRARRATQFTAQGVESQSWWFLGGRPSESDAPEPSTLLMGFAGGNVQWRDSPFKAYLAKLQGRSPGVEATDATERAPSPPPVAWPGGNSYLITVGCRFRQYVTLGPGAVVYDVGSTFELLNPAVQSSPRWVEPRYIPRRPEYRLEVDPPPHEISVFALPVLARLGGE